MKKLLFGEFIIALLSFAMFPFWNAMLITFLLVHLFVFTAVIVARRDDDVLWEREDG